MTPGSSNARTRATDAHSKARTAKRFDRLTAPPGRGIVCATPAIIDAVTQMQTHPPVSAHRPGARAGYVPSNRA